MAAELCVVILGVVIALAADGWRGDLRERQLGDEYSARLEAEISGIVDELLVQGPRFARAKDALWQLSELLDSDAAQDSVFVALLLRGSQTGLGDDAFNQLTYQELVTTGRVALVADIGARALLIDFYRGVDNLDDQLAGLSLNTETTGLTGFAAYRLNQGTRMLASSDIERIAAAARQSEFRKLIRADHASLDRLSGRFAILVEQGNALRSRLSER